MISGESSYIAISRESGAEGLVCRELAEGVKAADLFPVKNDVDFSLAFEFTREGEGREEEGNE